MKEENKEMIPTTAAAALVEMLRQYTPEKNHWNSEEPEKVFTSTSYRSMWIIGWPLLEKIASQSREIEELIDRKESFRESIKAAIENVISLQEAEQNETFNSGKEEAFNYAIEMLDKHFNDHYIVCVE